jgi:hypothetical protein
MCVENNLTLLVEGGFHLHINSSSRCIPPTLELILLRVIGIGASVCFTQCASKIEPYLISKRYISTIGSTKVWPYIRSDRYPEASYTIAVNFHSFI